MDGALSCGAFKDHDPYQLSQLCDESGIRQLELWDDDGYFATTIDEPLKIARALEAHGVLVRSVHASFLSDARLAAIKVTGYLQRYQLSCEKAAACGAAYVAVHPAVVDDEESSAATGVSLMPESLRLWRAQADIARRVGVEIAFENLPPSSGWPSGCAPSTVAEIVRSLAETGAGACLDVSHCYTVGVDPVRAVETLEGINLLGMHASDGVRSALSDRHLPPGEGDTDWPGLFSALKATGFAGAVVLEVKSPYLNAHLLRSISEFLIHAEGGDLQGPRVRKLTWNAELMLNLVKEGNVS